MSGRAAEPLRLFFALWPDPAAVARLTLRRAALRRQIAGRWLRAEDCHVTLVFLGPVAAAGLPGLRKLAGAITVPAFALVLDRLECWGRGRALCLTPTHVPAELALLVGRLEAGLSEAGRAPEGRSYRPHLTLARDVRPATVDEPPVEPITLAIRGFRLVQSAPQPDGARYRCLDSWRLAGGAGAGIPGGQDPVT